MTARASLQWVLALCACAFAEAASAQHEACVPTRVDPTPPGAPVAFRDCPDTPVLVTIPAGRFRMGDLLDNGASYEKPVHEVSVRRYALGRYEITRAEWAACALAKGCDELPAGAADPQLPVTDVSWDQAQRYVAWLTQRTHQPYRLPSEAEWEYAVRAGSETQYSWGNVVEFACQNANGFDRAGRKAHPQWDWQIECDDGYGEAAPVGRYAPNAWGLHDMLGNVWEWVADCWHADYTGAPADGRAWVEDGCAKRVNRGGGWGNHPRSLRVSNRDGDPAGSRSDGLGFRVARDLP